MKLKPSFKSSQYILLELSKSSLGIYLPTANEVDQVFSYIICSFSRLERLLTQKLITVKPFLCSVLERYSNPITFSIFLMISRKSKG